MSSILKALIMSAGDSGTDYINMPLTFKANVANSTVKLNCELYWGDACRLQYRTSSSNGWQDLNLETTFTLENVGDIIEFQNLDTFLNDTWDYYRIYAFECTGDLEIYGNLFSLINYSEIVPSYAFYQLFANCTAITDAKNLSINANSFGDNALESLFSGCSNLIYPPKLPSMNLGNYCYQNMFSGCSSLTSENLPELPATTLASQCYCNMFQNCTSLTTPPVLQATNLANNCYDNMFNGCTNLTETPILPATTLAEYCYNGMFQNCTSLTTPPALPATTVVRGCYQNMFNGCTSLTSAPVLAATTVYGWSYSQMFQGCTSLVTPPALPATTLTNDCYQAMFKGCTKLTSAPLLPATILANNCYSNMFYGCTSLTTTPILSANTLADSCYKQMFYNCSNLTSTTTLPATTLANNCYQSMFYGCSKLSSAPDLPAATMKQYCYNQMFYGCSSLTSAPILSATTLANYCYQAMFRNCSNLTSIPSALPATTLYDYCYNQMFYGCSNLSSAVELPAVDLKSNCYSQMFYNCSKFNNLNVKFYDWHASVSNVTYQWLNNTSSTGTFTCPFQLSEERGANRIPNNWTINYNNGNMIITNLDQGFRSKPNETLSGSIYYLVNPSGSVMTFTLDTVNGDPLPTGLSLNSSTGEITGICTTEQTANCIVQISSPGLSVYTPDETLIPNGKINVTIKIASIETTPHNLTSNTSDPRYILSSNTVHNNHEAWQAMDGISDQDHSFHTTRTSSPWWKIQFTGGPVSIVSFKWSNNEYMLHGGIFNSTGFKLQGSSDNSTWVDVYPFSIDSTANKVFTFNVDSTNSYTYWRITNTGYGYLVVGELEFTYS